MDIDSLRPLDGSKSPNIMYYSKQYQRYEDDRPRNPVLLEDKDSNTFTLNLSIDIQTTSENGRTSSIHSSSTGENAIDITIEAAGSPGGVTDATCTAFDVCRHSASQENNQTLPTTPRPADETRNGYTVHENMERRDSGFHTMTRNHDEKHLSTGRVKIVKSKSDVVVTKEPPSKSELSLPLNESVNVRRHRSSPLLTRKSPRQLENEAKSDKDIGELARRLFHFDGFEKNEIAKHFSKKDSYSEKLSQKYMEHFEFSGLSLEDALRMLLKRFALLGETQERERVLSSVSKRYLQCNPSFLQGNLDATHTLLCAIALLNTDLHGVKVSGRRRMTYKQFANNLAGLGTAGADFPTDLLKEIYRSIKKRPLPWCEKPSEKATKPRSATERAINKSAGTKSTAVLRSQSLNQPSRNLIHALPASREDSGVLRRDLGSGRNSKSKTLPRKQGILWRKWIVEPDGSKTPKRKRKWKLFISTLQGLELQLTKKDGRVSPVSLHHCVAEIEDQQAATRRSYVFRITMADSSVALYQTNSTDEQKHWISCINRNAALLSAAPLAAGVGSQFRFQKPLQPSHSSTLPATKQLRDQQTRLDALYTELNEVQNQQADKGSSESEVKYLEDKEVYLVWEIRKYELYTNTLDDLVALGARKFNDLQKVVEEDESRDSRSLLSISPSEPGAYFTSSSAEHFESSGDLLESSQPRSPLSPTSSLPNLIPMSVHRFPTSEASSSRISSSCSSGSGASYDLIPETASCNSNNSNAVMSQELPKATATRKLAQTHSEDELSHRKTSTLPKPRSNLIATSILSSSTAAMPTHPPQPTSRSITPLPDKIDFPRIRGRKERKGASRYSYLQAVNDVTGVN